MRFSSRSLEGNPVRIDRAWAPSSYLRALRVVSAQHGIDAGFEELGVVVAIVGPIIRAEPDDHHPVTGQHEGMIAVQAPGPAGVVRDAFAACTLPAHVLVESTAVAVHRILNRAKR